MNRKGFLSSLMGLILAPKILKAETFDELIHRTELKTTVPVGTSMVTAAPEPKEDLVFFIQQRYVPNEVIPTVEFEMKSAPGNTVCLCCFNRYDHHAWIGTSRRGTSLRDICDVKHTMMDKKTAMERTRKFLAGEEY